MDGSTSSIRRRCRKLQWLYCLQDFNFSLAGYTSDPKYNIRRKIRSSPFWTSNQILTIPTFSLDSQNCYIIGNRLLYVCQLQIDFIIYWPFSCPITDQHLLQKISTSRL